MISIDAKALKAEIDKLKKDFQKFSIETSDEVSKAVLTAALKVETQAKQLFKGRNEASVDGEPPRVQTGRLRASITHRMISETTGEVGTSADYAIYLEFGTSRTMKHPFLVPALEMKRDEVLALIKQGILKAVDRATK